MFCIMLYISSVTTFCSELDGMVELMPPSLPSLSDHETSHHATFRRALHEDNVSVKKPRDLHQIQRIVETEFEDG